MHVFLSWLTTPFFLGACAITLLTWEVLLRISRQCGEKFHYWFLAQGVGLLLIHLRLTGRSVSIRGAHHIPKHGPLIVVTNHQSLFDVPLLMWYLRRFRPRFVAKAELGRGFPCASYILRTGGSALIERNNGAQAVAAIREMGSKVAEGGFAACIFPEGTRSKNGALKEFKWTGVRTLLSAAPTAVVLPGVIKGSFDLFRHRLVPVPFGGEIVLEILPPISRTANSEEEIVQRIGGAISAAFSENRAK